MNMEESGVINMGFGVGLYRHVLFHVTTSILHLQFEKQLVKEIIN